MPVAFIFQWMVRLRSSWSYYSEPQLCYETAHPITIYGQQGTRLLMTLWYPCLGHAYNEAFMMCIHNTGI